MATMVSAGRSSSDFRNADEPVYLLTRRRSSFPPPPASSRLMVVPAEAAEPQVEQRDSLAEFIQPDPAQWDGEPSDDDDDMSNIRPARRFTRRRRAIRVLGGLAIIGTLVGGSYVLQQPQVRDEALSFVTLGHEDAAKRFGRRIAAIVEDLRHR
jgi:hypothetical protein